jgi:outer membrane protein OmpA-like peptidoglycan-associated protein
MKLSWMSSASLALIVLTTVGCQSNSLKTENAALKRDNENLRAQLRGSASPQQLQQWQDAVAQREARIRELETQLRRPEPGQPAAAADPGIAGIATSYDRVKGELTVSLPSDVLFTPGSADLKSTSRSTLEKIVSALKKDYAGKKIRVEGHTDKDPIVRSQDKWIDNLDLSQNRAGAVARYLIDRGISRGDILTVGYGDTRPKLNKTASRRVEIVVVTG